MTNIELKLVKKWFNTIDLAKEYSRTAGRIVFDKRHKIICVDGEVFGAKVADVDISDGILSITYGDGAVKKLDFTNINTTLGYNPDGTLRNDGVQGLPVFGQLQGIIGINGDDIKPDYTGTRFIQGSGNAVQGLVQADINLDRAIAELSDNDYEYKTFKKTVANDDYNASYGVFRKKHADDDTSIAGWGNDPSHTAINPWDTSSDNKWSMCGEWINIPKDFLVTSVVLRTVITAGSGTLPDEESTLNTNIDIRRGGGDGTESNPYNWKIGDKVMDFTINTKQDGDSQTESNTHIYVNINELFDSYIGDTNIIISNYIQGRPGGVTVNVDNEHNHITADLNNQSIQGRHILPEVVIIPEQTKKYSSNVLPIIHDGWTTNDFEKWSAAGWKLEILGEGQPEDNPNWKEYEWGCCTSKSKSEPTKDEHITLNYDNSWKWRQNEEQWYVYYRWVKEVSPEIRNDDNDVLIGSIQVGNPNSPGGVLNKELRARIGIYWSEWDSPDGSVDSNDHELTW